VMPPTAGSGGAPGPPASASLTVTICSTVSRLPATGATVGCSPASTTSTLAPEWSQM
jgi:hypothetical protein